MSKLSEAMDYLRPATDADGSPVLQREYDALRAALKEARGWLEIAAEHGNGAVGRPEAFREPIAQIDAALSGARGEV